MASLFQRRSVTKHRTTPVNGRAQPSSSSPRWGRLRAALRLGAPAPGALGAPEDGPKPEPPGKQAEVFEPEAKAEPGPTGKSAAEDGEGEARGEGGYFDDGDRTLRLYMRDIGRVKLLTLEEEAGLAKRIRRGDKKAREQMIKSNLRLVVKIARDYDGIGLPLLDLINEGNLGLMKAVERFDPAKGGRLSTYGSWWIRQGIKRALANQSKTIRLPVHVVEKLGRMRRLAYRLHEELGREPSDEELAEELGMAARRVTQMRLAAMQTMSLDAPLGEDDTARLGEVVKDERAGTPYDELEAKTVTGMVRDLVGALDVREAAILRARFGLDGEPVRTLEEVGRKFRVTRERIRQLQNLALSRLRAMIQKTEGMVPGAARLEGGRPAAGQRRARLFNGAAQGVVHGGASGLLQAGGRA